ncbi:dihydrolipoyl dehydrogenase family protein [Minwuia thermotolerans]|uniref:NAD(P)/FAD-dependent oxidoreductase n=1 Tax=Minwuia thermotolerans TaxID=2056226 RepID=A0A2M9G0H4_9PROT|nr:NAD(P)/FAD-dependent oxidoreductase [Minwuia thermotolerans]PJK29218.1 NAD(P)/FAD-dependent oxidoreductase [Minwuia thermotolerans]
MSCDYDLAIIGTGVAASTVATKVRAAGQSVVAIDSRPFGGTCALRGCDPKKLLLAGADAVDHAQRATAKGVRAEPVLDWPTLQSARRRFTNEMQESMEELYESHGIKGFHGRARFTGTNSLAIGDTKISAEHILIAAGAEPVSLDMPGAEHLTTSDEFLELDRLPQRIVLVGGGYVAAEFSHIAACGGAEVTILQRGERLLKNFDPDLVGWLAGKFERLGIEVETGTEVRSIETNDNELVVTARRGDRTIRRAADLVVHAAGRVPALEDLNLAAGGVDVRGGRLVLNEFLQSASNPSVYAAGDAAQMGPPLTPVSSQDGHVVAANLLEGNHRSPDYRGTPSVAFTLPPIAAVGFSEAEARNLDLAFTVNSDLASDWFTARQADEPVYGYKVLVEDETRRILGAHLVGPRVDEVINLFALAIRAQMTADQLKQMPFAYPTTASDIPSMLS